MDLKRTYIKWRYWEFWPTWLIYLPVLLCYPFWALRCRTWFLYASVNPSLEMGGLYGASKFKALTSLPKDAVPETLFFEVGSDFELVLSRIKEAALNLPLIIKPDYGERGQGVDLIVNQGQLRHSIVTQTSDFIAQAYLDMPFEAGIFYLKRPEEQEGHVPSIVVKGFLTVTGDGKCTVEELALRNRRAYLIWPTLRNVLDVEPSHVPDEGEELVLEPIGNHSRGTAFEDGNSLWTEAIETWAQRMANELPGFYYGRFDVRAPSLEAFKRGENLMIMEVNGANAEPAHIYQEGYSLFRAWITLIRYWNTMSKIAAYNLKRSDPVNFSTAHKFYKRWRSIKTDKWDRASTLSS